MKFYFFLSLVSLVSSLIPIPNVPMPQVLAPIVAPHGIIDAFHAIDTNKTKEYAVANGVGLLVTNCAWSTNHDMVMVMFMLLSSFHFRHQFGSSPVSSLNTISGLIPLILAFILVSYSLIDPLVTYCFIGLVHTPHQYWENAKYFTPTRFGLLGALTCLSVIFSDRIGGFLDNPLIMGIVIGHIIYQEFVVREDG